MKEKMIKKLKKIIDDYGPDYLADQPYEVYLKLTGSNAVDRKTGGALLCLLVSEAMDQIGREKDQAVLSGKIQKACGLNKKASDQLAEVMLSLYSEENQAEWDSREQEGMKQFLDEDFEMTWNGYAVWDAGNGTVECRYEAEISLSPKEEILQNPALAEMISKNPFLKKEEIHAFFERKIKSYLDDEFEEYCTDDDYYQPVVEDFELDYRMEQWGKENGFEVLFCDGKGYDEGYEPKFRRGWY